MKILDYRRASYAVELFNGGELGFEQLSKRPDLTELLLELARAQQGAGATLDGVFADLRAQRQGDDEDDD